MTGPGAGGTRQTRHEDAEYRSGSDAKKGEAPPGNVSMTFLTDVMKKVYSEEKIFAVLVESDQDRKRRRVLAKVTETVEAHRLQKMRDLLTFEKLATWRRMNDFDRVEVGEDNWFHGPRSLPPTPEEFTESLWSKVNELDMKSRCLLRLGLGRRRWNLLTDSKKNSRMRNLP